MAHGVESWLGRKHVSCLLFIRHTPLALVRSHTPPGSQMSCQIECQVVLGQFFLSM